MTDEIILCPFERAVVGGRGHILTRHNRAHEKEAVRAIRSRRHPKWSFFASEIEVAA